MNDKKERILHAAISLFAAKGINVPTAQIAKEAGVSNGTLFNNFATKQALFDAVYLFTKFHMAENLLGEAPPDNTLEKMFYTHWKRTIIWGISFPENHKALCLLRSANVISDDVIAKIESMFASSYSKLEEAMEQKIIRKIPIQLLCELANASLTTAIQYATSCNLSEEELHQHIDLTFSIFWKGIQA